MEYGMTMSANAERRQIAAGCFFTEEELRAQPHLRRLQAIATPAASDPNTRPVTAEARKMAASDGVCAYCYEPGDERSPLVQTVRRNLMHPECDEAWTAALIAAGKQA